ncbi:MAG: UTP--glucose-1-phosphate uridylyltransferase GalU [Patescibacteria group bacterium]
MKAIIAVAGIGTRFLPVTKTLPKEMLPIVDKPVVHYLVEEAVASGIKDIIFITSIGKHALEDYFDRNFELEYRLREKGKIDLLGMIGDIQSMANFYYVRQKEPKGNAHAIMQAQNLIGNEACMAMFGDDIVVSEKPCAKQLIDIYNQYGCPVLALDRVPINKVSLYGIVDGVRVGDKNKRLFELKKIVEKPNPKDAPSNLSIIGRYIITPDIFREIKKTKPGKNGEVGLTETFAGFIKNNLAYGYEFEGTRYDCGSKIGFLKANVAFGLKHPETGKELANYIKTIKKN